jgi:transglutaminase-like putative cysteine protease
MAEHGLERPISALLRRAWRGEKLITLLLLFILLTVAIAGMTAVLTGPDWASLWESLLLGLLVGWFLAILKWPAWRAALLVVGLGLLFCLLFAGSLNVKVLAVIEELFRLAGDLPAWLKTGKIDFGPLGSAGQQLSAASTVVLNRVIVWVGDLITGQAAFDPVAAGIVWSLVVWLVAAWAGWVVEAGHSALLAVLPALGLNLATLSSGRSNSLTIYLMLGLTLVLIAVVQYAHQQQGWEHTMVAYPQHKGRQLGYTSLVIASMLVVLSALISSLSLKQIELWTSHLNQTGSTNGSGLAKSLGIQEPTPTPSSFSTVSSPGLPRELLIGSGPELSHEEVMSVEIIDLTSLVNSGQLPPLYWRSYTYDIYNGHGWSSSSTTQSQYSPNQPIQPDLLPYHQSIQQMVNPVPGQSGTIYAAGEPVSVNVATMAAWRGNNDLFGIQTTGNNYTVQSLIPIVGADSLRAAGQNYPAWIKQRYLALPSEVTSRVKELAIQLTAAEPTPYDRAHAIEQYLRSTFPYTTDVPYPPSNQDLVDYFLFSLRQGYCDYYASSMVVLARAAGLPTRLAIGYATGTYNLNSKRFIVSQADAHSWVEVYFPGIGWVPFEPTAGIPSINRSGQPTQEPSPITPVKVPPPRKGPAAPNETLFVYIGLGLLVVTGCVWAVYDEVYLRHLEPQRAAAEIYRRMRRYGSLLKLLYEIGQTPNEYSFVMTTGLARIAHLRPATTAQITAQIETIIRRIVRLSYRPSEKREILKVQILQQWRALRWQLRLMRIQMVWGTIQDIFQRNPMPNSDDMQSSVSQE